LKITDGNSEIFSPCRHISKCTAHERHVYNFGAEHQWLTAVIPSTEEVEIGGVKAVDQDQPQAKVHKTSSQPVESWA
jgi:hypothetical protein